MFIFPIRSNFTFSRVGQKWPTCTNLAIPLDSNDHGLYKQHKAVLSNARYMHRVTAVNALGRRIQKEKNMNAEPINTHSNFEPAIRIVCSWVRRSGQFGDTYPVTIGDIGTHQIVCPFPIISAEWTISTTNIVAGFSPTSQAGSVIPVTAAMLTSQEIAFAFTTPGEYVVTAIIVSEFGTQFTSNTFVVTGPSVTSINSVTASILIYNDANGNPWMGFGRPGSPGIEIDADVVGDSIDDGQLCFIQLAQNYRECMDTSGWTYDLSTNGQWILDVGLTGDFIYQNTVVAISTGQTKWIYATDAPGTQLPNPTTSSYLAFLVGDGPANLESYQTFLMFRPNTGNSVWVPIARLEWGWTAMAELLDGVWVLSETYGPENPVGESLNTFPQWSTNTAARTEWNRRIAQTI